MLPVLSGTRDLGDEREHPPTLLFLGPERPHRDRLLGRQALERIDIAGRREPGLQRCNASLGRERTASNRGTDGPRHRDGVQGTAIVRGPDGQLLGEFRVAERRR